MGIFQIRGPFKGVYLWVLILGFDGGASANHFEIELWGYSTLTIIFVGKTVLSKSYESYQEKFFR